MNEKTKSPIKGEEHWASKDGGVKLFMWEKCAGDPAKAKGIILFVHGSSMASTPSFDLQVPGVPDSSGRGWFARRGVDGGARGTAGGTGRGGVGEAEVSGRAGRRAG